jgi:hypothetical protein
MDESLRAQIDTYLSHLDGLIRRGRRFATLWRLIPPTHRRLQPLAPGRKTVAVTINQLSGGSKAHWLARSFSEAFLMRSADGQAVEGAAPAEIVERLLGVLEQAVARSPEWTMASTASASSEAPVPRRFDFVHNPELRPFSSRPTPIAGAPLSKPTTTWRCSPLAEFWKPL